MLVFTYRIRPLANNSFHIYFALYNRKAHHQIQHLFRRTLTVNASNINKITNYLEAYTEETFEDIQENFDNDTGEL
ncbi:hypothetical protein EST38_g12090 [Candolleomyces aberdarensis]|uniref:Uncharacterized protein n=1 Tax=Candolleomyces aberdarensis TaxID=2316362 RepID=A0A4Q2D5W0_9AGAR|nr:hypothetical protein EST38_g12090 [Candolleomyces aberdarensis]